MGAAIEDESVGAHDALFFLLCRYSGLIVRSRPFSARSICASMTARVKLSGRKPGSSSPPTATKL